MVGELGRNLFSSLLTEFLVLILAILVRHDKQKMITVLGLGTLLSGIIGFGAPILQSIGINLGGDSVECNSWNLAFDFRVYPSQENPNRDSCGNRDVWYFMKSSTLERMPNNYSLLENFVADAFGIPGYQQWQGDHVWSNRENIYFPSVSINTTDKTKTIETAIHPSKSIAVHPWDVKSLVIIGWKSPISGIVSISGFVNDLDSNGGDGILWFIDEGNQPLSSGAISDGGKQAFLDGNGSENLENLVVTKGDFIYLIVHPNSNDLYDTTWVDIQITLR